MGGTICQKRERERERKVEVMAMTLRRTGRGSIGREGGECKHKNERLEEFDDVHLVEERFF